MAATPRNARSQTPPPSAGEAILTPALLARLKTRRDGPGIRRALLHVTLLAIGLGAIATAHGTLWLLPAMLGQGVALLSLFAALHETVHGTAFRYRPANRFTAALCGFILILPAGYFRAFHFAHHRFTQHRGQDPELAGPCITTRHDYLVYMTGVRVLKAAVSTLLRHARGQVDEAFISPERRPAVVHEARVHLALYVAALAASPFLEWWPLMAWFGPLVLAEPVRRAWLFSEHNGCDEGADMFANTRTTDAPAWLRALIWDMNYHTAHHVAPAVPFHSLRKLDAAIAPHIKYRSPSFIAVHRGWKPKPARVG